MGNKLQSGIISPSKCISSLTEFNHRVLSLVNMVDLIITKMSKDIDPEVIKIIQKMNDEVKEFYNP